MKKKRERKKDWIEELDAILFEDLPYWYRNEFDSELFFIRLQYMLDNIEPVVSLLICSLFYCGACGSCFAIWSILEDLKFTENFFFRTFTLFFLLAWWFDYLSFSIMQNFVGLRSDYIYDKHILSLKRERLRCLALITPRKFSASSYYPEEWVEENKNEADNWLDGSFQRIYEIDQELQESQGEQL